jgi:hypothetical protein
MYIVLQNDDTQNAISFLSNPPKAKASSFLQ